MRAILDTSVVIANDVPHLPGELAISAVTVAELTFGILVSDNYDAKNARLMRLSRVRHYFEALPVDDKVAESYGQLATAVVHAGRQPRGRVMDLLIAATAHAHEARLYTRNPKDFVGIDHLVEVVPV